MALDRLVDNSLLNDALENTADAIRVKTGGSSLIEFDYDTVTNSGFANAIGTIVTLEEGTATDTATSGDILSGKTAHVQGQLVTGNIPTKTSSDLSASGKTVTVPAGYYAQQYTKSVETGSATTPATSITANPTISVDNSGLISATVSASKSVTPTVSAGYVSSGTAGTVSVSGSAENQLSVQEGRTVTPTESEQTAVDSGKYTTGVVKVGAIPSTYVGSDIPQNDSDDLIISENVVSVPNGYYAEDTSATIAVGTVTSGTATISSVSVSDGTDASKFSLSGSANVSAPTVGTAGYVSSTKGTKNATSGGATLSATVDKIIGTASISETKKKPSITKQSTPSGVTNAASGNATTTAPTSGIYVAVKSAENVSTVTPTVSITTSGYGTSSKHGITASGASVGAAASDMTYVPITVGSATTPATSVTANPTISIDSDGLITATVSGSKSVTPTVSAGYVSSGTAGTVTVSGSNTSQLSILGATTYNVSTTADRTIASGTYLTGDQTIRKLTTSGISAGNIKKGAVVKVGDSGSATRIHNVTGTFTSASTVSSGQTAADAGDIKSGKSAWVDGVEVKGSLANTSISEGITTVSGTSATRGTATWGDGVISSGEMNAAVFANEATTGKTYVNISDTTDAPVLIAGDYLYINKGYTDDLKISLAKLVPDGSDVKGHGEYIISGHSAYDNDGTLVAGTIPTLKASDVSVSGKTVTIPVGKYTGASGSTAVTKSVADGSVVPAVNSHSITTTPVVTGSIGGTVTNISSTTKPSGTDGTNYWTINPTGSVTTTGVSTTNAKATVTAGYIASSPANSNNSTVDITPTVTDGTKRYIAKGTATQNAPTVNASGLVTATSTITAGYQTASTPSNTLQLSTQGATTITPTESEQTAVASGKYTTGIVKVSAIPADYVGSDIDQNDSEDLVVSENNLTVPAGYYAEDASTTVPVGTVTSGTATISSVTISDGSNASKFAVSGSANVSAPTVGTAGYISSTKGTKNVKSSGATVSATINKIVGSTSISETKKKPVIEKQDTPSGVTNAASGEATTTAPSSGVYVAVKSAENVSTVTPGFSITTSGYGTSSKHGITATGASVGADASDTTYVPIATTTASVSGKTVSYGSGWITEGSSSVSDVVGSIGGTSSNGKATAAISNVNSMNTISDISGKTAGTDYWTVKATATGTAGGYTPKYTVTTAGWLNSTVTGSKQTVSVTADSTGKSIYIPKAVIEGTSTNATAITTVDPGTVSVTKQSTPSGVTNAASGDATTTAPTSGVYVAVKATAAANSTGTTSSISGSGSATVSTAGYAPTTLTGSITVSGTATAKTSSKDSSMTYVPITTASPTFKGGAVSGTATASSSTGADISTSVNNSGITIDASASATRAVVQYNSAVSGWVTKSASADAYAAGSATDLTGTTYYLNGATMSTPSSGTRTFSVVAPDGSNTHTYLFTVDENGKTSIKVDTTLTMQWNATDESLDFIYT